MEALRQHGRILKETYSTVKAFKAALPRLSMACVCVCGMTVAFISPISFRLLVDTKYEAAI